MEKSIGVLILFLFINILSAQEFEPYKEGGSKKFAELCMNFNNYREALVEYRALSQRDPQNPFYKHQIARCHLNLHEDKSRAIPVLSSLTKNIDYEESRVWYDLGRAYLATGHIDSAEIALQRYQEQNPEGRGNRIPAARLLAMCHNADSLMHDTVKAKIENAGAAINSEHADFFPLVTGDESRLIFTTERPGNSARHITLKGRYNADLWKSRRHNESWRRARRISSGRINTRASEYGVSMTPDGNQLLLIYEPEQGNRFILHAEHQRRHFSRPEPYSEKVINKEKYDMNGACISKNEDLIIFSATTGEDNSNFNLYISQRDPDEGQWSEPEKMGPQINTAYNDAYPVLTPDENYLVFASEGHNSMGGYDLMITPFSTDTNHNYKVRNIGYPINTTIDDKSITFTQDMRYAYKSFLKSGGYGDLDIYRITLPDTNSRYSHVKGSITIEGINSAWEDTASDTSNEAATSVSILPYTDVEIEVFHTETREPSGKWEVDPVEGNFHIKLPPGDYEVHFHYPGYRSEQIHVELSGAQKKNKIINQDIKIKTKESE
ncbi:MAG: hypothetical protein R6U19_05320 [Bacteroidales bacterium]